MGNLGFSFRPYHPGELLKEELECRKISQKSFAINTGMSYKFLNEILNCKRPVTGDFALLVESKLGVEPKLLLRMQESYNLQVAKNNKKLKNNFSEIKKIASTIL